jgi:hypothetical protein
MKVKLLKVRTPYCYDDYGNSYPSIESESPWEEISNEDHSLLCQWARERGYKNGYHYIVFEESDVRIQECIKSQMEKEIALREKYAREEEARKKEFEKKKLLSKKKKLEKLRKELASLEKNES